MKRFEDEVLSDLLEFYVTPFDWEEGYRFYEDDTDEAVYPVVEVGRNPINNRPIFQRLRHGIQSHSSRIRQAVLPPAGSNFRGVWVEGSRGDAVELARRLGLHSITEGERHGGGYRHVHGYAGHRRSQRGNRPPRNGNRPPTSRRSEHIFYGNRPPRIGQNFFD